MDEFPRIYNEGDYSQEDSSTDSASFSGEEYLSFITGDGESPSLYSIDGDNSSIGDTDTMSYQRQLYTDSLSVMNEDRYDLDAVTLPEPGPYEDYYQMSPKATGEGYVDPRQIVISYQQPDASHNELESTSATEIQRTSDHESKDSLRIKSKPSRQKQKKEVQCNRPGCGKTFPRPRELNRHLKTHTKPVSCEVCSKTTATRRDLDRHYATHHPRYFEKNIGPLPGKLPCGWNSCESTFARKDHRKRHLNKHHRGFDPFK